MWQSRNGSQYLNIKLNYLCISFNKKKPKFILSFFFMRIEWDNTGRTQDTFDFKWIENYLWNVLILIQVWHVKEVFVRVQIKIIYSCRQEVEDVIPTNKIRNWLSLWRRTDHLKLVFIWKILICISVFKNNIDHVNCFYVKMNNSPLWLQPTTTTPLAILYNIYLILNTAKDLKILYQTA